MPEEPEAPPSGAEDDPEAAPRAAEEAPKDRAADIAKNVTIVTAFLFLGRTVGGPARELILSRFIGTTAASDAFRFAYESILQDIYTKFEKLLQPIYIPLFVGLRRQEGERPAWRYTGILGTLQTLLLIVVAALGFSYAREIALWVIGDDPDVLAKLGAATPGHEMLVSFLRLFFPALIVYSLSNLAELTLQAYNRFTVPAFAEAFRRLAIVGGLVLIVVWLRRPSEEDVAVALVWGALVGIAGRLLFQLPSLWRQMRLLRPSLDLANPTVRKALILAIPLVVGIIFSFVRNLAEAKFAFGEGVGAYSGLKYARKLVDMPWQVLALAISYVIYPFISALGADQDRNRLADALVSTSRVIAFFFVPLTAFFLICGEPTVRVAYEGFRFEQESVDITMQALPWYVLGMFFFALEDPLLKWFYALHDTKTPIAMGIAGNLIWFAVAGVGLFYYDFGLSAIAFAMTASKAIKVVVLLALLRPRLGEIPRGEVASFAVRLAVTTGVAAAGAWFTLGQLQGMFPPLTPEQAETAGLVSRLMPPAIHLFGCFAVSLGAYLVASFVLRIEECWLVADRLKAKLRRGNA